MLEVEQPFRTDFDYFEERAQGIADSLGMTLGEARLRIARRHGFGSWRALRRHVEAIRDGSEPRPVFMDAYDALEARDAGALEALLDRHPELVRARGTNGNDLLNLADDLGLVRLLLERGADPNRGNVYGWTKLHQAGYANRRELATVLLAAGARTDLSARGDGGTPLVAALFWGHREVVDLLGLEPRNLRVAAGLGLPDMIRELHRTPQAASRAGSRRTTRSRSSTRRSSGRRRRAGWRRSSSSSSSARASTPTSIAAPPSTGQRPAAASRRSGSSSGSAPTRTGRGRSAAPRTARR
jgi:hypothetical protein